MTAQLPPPSDHLDLDALADVLAGERADDGHLSRCAFCAQRLGELSAAQEGVVAALAALPDPALPDGFEARLAAALAAAGAEGTGAGSAEPGPAAAAPAPHEEVRRVTALPRRTRPVWLPAAAASLVLVLGGGLGYALLAGSGTEADDATASAAGGAVEPDRSSEESSALSVPEDSDASRSGPAEPESAQADAPEQETAPPESAGVGPAGTDAAEPARSATGADYADEAQREAVLPRVLAGPEPDDAPDEPLVDGPLARLRSPQALAGCLAALTQSRGVAPLALDEAAFRGEPALAVVLPAAEPGEVVVHVVGADCAAGDPHELLVVRTSRP